MANHHNASYHPEISFFTDFPNLDSAHGGEPSMPSQLDMSYDDRDSHSAVQNNFNLMSYPDRSSTAGPSNLAASAEGPGSCSLHFSPSDNVEPGVVHPASSQSRARKPLKERPRIDLAADQPPTTQGRPRARVFVACLQCRGRKIRCDGAKPKCYHCSQRDGNKECTYDVLPKRRGPDRIQRARTSGKRQETDGGPPPRRRRRGPDQAASESEGITGHASSVAGADERNNTDEATHQTIEIPEAYIAFAQYRLELDLSDITPDPSVQFSRETWFDHVRDLYAVSMQALDDDSSINQIVEDVRFVFKSSYHWFSFLNVPRFYNNFMDPIRRGHMQPSLLLSLLAVSKFFQGAGRLCPEESHHVALLLRDEAQGYLEASLHARAIDVELAQAAWTLAFFEILSHPQHNLTRIRSSLNILDSILRLLAMTDLDANNPTASTFARNAVPVVEVSSEKSVSTSKGYQNSMFVASPTQQCAPKQQSLIDTTVPGSGCLCDKLSLGSQWPEAHKQVPFWVSTPMWNREWSEGEINKEECRRVRWSALMLVSGQTSFADAVNWKPQDLFIVEPSNYSILFPGESLLPSHPRMYCDTTSGKNTVWALYLRAMLLWNACVRMRQDTRIRDFDKRDFAMRAWIESEAIEEALQCHTCSVEKAFVFHGREILFNTRMCISFGFQRFIPHVLVGLNRGKSEEWLRAQGKLAKAIIIAIYTTTDNQELNILQRPWYMFWFMGQTYRAFKLWKHDNSLTIALDVCMAFLEIIQHLVTFYPGPAQQRRLDGIRGLVLAALASAGGYVPTPIDKL